MSALTPTFQGEVQLRRWSESSTQGVQVTFALADSDDLEPLKIKSGKRFMAVLVEIGDDEAPVPQSKDLQDHTSRKEPIGPLCKWLVQRCKEPEFWDFLTSEFQNGPAINSEPDAAEFVKELLGIESRKEIDTNLGAESTFHTDIRHPYQKWLLRRSG